jgi:hypothetical protein
MKLPILILCGVCILGSGVGLGWVWRGQSDGSLTRDEVRRLADAGDAASSSRQLNGRLPPASPNAKEKGRDVAQAKAAGGTEAESPADAARRILHNILEDGGGRNGPPAELFEFLQALAGCDAATLHGLLDEYRAASKSRKGPGRQGELAMIITARLAGIDPEGALDRLLELKKEGGRMDREIVFFMAAAAAKNHPSRMEAMIARMPDDESKKAAETAWLSVRAREDPNGVLQELAAAPPTDEAGLSRAREVIRSAAGRAPEKALEVIGKLGEAEGQSRMVGEVMQIWLDRDSQAAAKWAVDSRDAAALNACLRADASLVDADQLRREFNSLPAANPEARTELASGLAGNLAQQDVNGAINWSASLPEGERAAAQASIGRAWIDKDPVAASEWLATWPAGGGKDSVASYLVNRISSEDPESAFVWACSIQGEPRINSIGRAISAMKAKDPAAAEQALNGLSEGERVAVSRTMEMRKGR